MQRIKLPPVSVLTQFIGIIVLVLVLPFSALLLLTTSRLSSLQTESAAQYLSSNLKTVSATVDQALKNLEFSHTNIFQDAKFLNGMKRLSPYDTREEYSDFRNTTAIKSRIGEVSVINDYIYSIYAYSFPAQRIFSSKINWNPDFNHFDGADTDWMKTYLESKLQHPWYITKEIREERVILSSYREIWTYGSDSPIGLLSLNVDAKSITHLLDEVSPNQSSHTFILDGRGNFISNQTGEDALVFNQIISQMPQDSDQSYFDLSLSGAKMYASFYTSPYSNFTYVIATPLSAIQTATPVMIQLILLFLFLLALSIVLAMILARHFFFTPITALFAGMRRVQEGDFSVRLPKSPTHEFGYINRNFNNMVENIQKLITENYTAALVNKEAELRNIQNQLNEHFLYNTLDSIHWLARIEDAPRACDMVFALANFYRLSLSSGKHVIPIRDVIEMLRNYLFIQKFRMRDGLEYTITCDPALESKPILKSLLQPIVENAILHGLKGIAHTGRIEVCFSSSDGMIRAMVQDNGVGFDADSLARVKEQLALEDPYCAHSFALKTIQSQMRIFYAENIQVHIETELGKGTTVWFDLPAKRQEDL